MGRGRYKQFLVHRYSGFSSPDQKRKRTKGSIAFSAAPGRSGRGPGILPGAYTAVNCSYSSALIALSLLSRSVATLSRSAEGAVPRLTGFNPVRLPLRRHSALLFRDGLRNLIYRRILFPCTVFFVNRTS